jgi:uncharacterized repeat protein (TIGR01451 family)
MRRSALARALPILLLCCAAGGEALAAGVPAGTDIENTAEVTYSVGGSSVSANSNTVTLRVAEVLDVVVTAQTPTVSVGAGASSARMVFRVTNTGNGSEAFRLELQSVLGGDDFDPVPAAPSLYFDTDGSGTLTPADTPYVAGSNDPVLAADAFVTLIAAHSIPGGLANAARGLARLDAAARTGTGAPGAVFAGAGAGGTDAIAGSTGADADAVSEYQVADIALAAVKSATVLDPFGGSRTVPGSRITYQIVVTPTGSGSAASATVVDPIPPNTRYLSGSLRLNGATLTEASDGDAGSYTTSPTPRVSVGLGDLTQASGPQTVLFVVTVD